MSDKCSSGLDEMVSEAKKKRFGAQTSTCRSSRLIEIIKMVDGLIEIVRRLRQRVEAGGRGKAKLKR